MAAGAALLALSAEERAAARATQEAKKVTTDEADPLRWQAVTPDRVEGMGWRENTAAPFDRLPAKAEQTVTPAVWRLARHSAGLCYHFTTDAPTLSVRWSLTGAELDMPHMPATGVSGVDLYVRTAAPGGPWRIVQNGRPLQQNDNVTRFTPPGEGKREYRLYFPLYNGTAKLEVAVPEGHALDVPAAYPAARAKPVVFYGTSITQGGCASRPGLAFVAIAGRKLDRPTINLGFSGNGRMEMALADLLCELDPSMIVLDCLRNMSVEQVQERVEPFVRRLRQKFGGDVPVVLAEDPSLALPPESVRGKIIREVVEKLTKEGIPGLHYLPMRFALGEDGEGTVDTVHPNDLGMMRMADAFVAGLKPLLPR